MSKVALRAISALAFACLLSAEALAQAAGTAPAPAADPAADPADPVDPAAAGTRTADGPEKPKLPSEGDVARGLFVGVGIGLTHNFGGARASEFNVAQRDDGSYFVQAKKSEDTDIRVIFETHYLIHPTYNNFADGVGTIAACGPFAFATVSRCGPFVAAALSPSAEVVEFGIGWMIGMGDGRGSKANDGFALGIGLMINPDAETIDGRVVDRTTMTIRSEFVKAYQDGSLTLTSGDSTVSALVLVTKTF